MLRIVLEIEGSAMNMSPMQVVEENVLSPNLKRVGEGKPSIPIEYNGPLVKVTIVEAGQR